VPGLTVVLVATIRQPRLRAMKGKAAYELGMKSETVRLPADTPEVDLLALLDKLNADRAVHGNTSAAAAPRPHGLEQGPAPDEAGEGRGGFTPSNVGKLVIGDPSGFRPCTPAGVQELLVRSGADPSGKHVSSWAGP